MRASADAFARFSPWIAVGAALLYFLHERLGLGGFLPLIACCAGLAVAGTLIRWRDAVHAPAGATFDAPRRALRATVVLLPASIVIAVLRVVIAGDVATRSAIITAVLPVLLGMAHGARDLQPLPEHEGYRLPVDRRRIRSHPRRVLRHCYLQ